MSQKQTIHFGEGPKPEITYDISYADERTRQKHVLMLEDDVYLSGQLKEALENKG